MVNIEQDEEAIQLLVNSNDEKRDEGGIDQWYLLFSDKWY